MSEESRDIMKVDSSALPAHLQKAAGERKGLEDVGQFQTVPRIGLVQANSKKERREQFGEGALVIFPDGLLAAAPGDELVVIPIVFFPTWEVWSDIDDDSTPFVEEVSYDPRSEIAARSKNKNQRVEKYGDEGQFKRKFVESINVICMIDSGPSQGEVAVLSFNGWNHRVGRRLASMLKRRPCDIFGNRVAVKSYHEDGGKYEFYGLELNNPTEEDGGAFVQDAELFAKCEKLHTELDEMVKAQKIGVFRDDHDEPSGGGGDDEGDDLPPI